MARSELRTRTRRETLPKVSPALVAGLLMLGEFAAFAATAGQGSMVLRSFLVALPLIVFIARKPVVGIYALTFLIPLELFARIPNEFFSLYKLLGLLTLTSTVVHAIAGTPTLQWQRTALHRWVFGFLFLMAASLLWSMEPELTMQAVRRLVTLVIFYFLTIRLVDSRQKLRVLMAVIVVGAVAAAIFAIWSHVADTAVFDTQSTVSVGEDIRASGASLDANFFAATILIALPMCLLMLPVERNTGIRIALGLGAIAIVLATVYSFSRGGALTMALMLLLVFGGALRRLRGRALLGVLGGALVALLLALALLPDAYLGRVQSLKTPMAGDEAIRGRWLYVQYGGEAVRESPLGVGAGCFPIAFGESRFNQYYNYYDLDPDASTQGRSAHNMYLEVAVESGLLGGLLFVSMLVFAISEGVRTGRHLREKDDGYLAAASAAITIGLVGFAFASLFLSAQYEKTLWLFLALIVVLKNLAYEGEAFRPDLRKLKRALARRQRRLEA